MMFTGDPGFRVRTKSAAAAASEALDKTQGSGGHLTTVIVAMLRCWWTINFCCYMETSHETMQSRQPIVSISTFCCLSCYQANCHASTVGFKDHHHVRLLRVAIRNRTYRNIKVPKASNCQLVVEVNTAEQRCNVTLYSECKSSRSVCIEAGGENPGMPKNNFFRFLRKITTESIGVKISLNNFFKKEDLNKTFFRNILNNLDTLLFNLLLAPVTLLL